MMEPTILTVDDDRVTRFIVSATFRAFACRVLEAADGVEGLAMADQERPDLIILDHNMPVMDGVETLSRLKADPELRKIPVLMLTAHSHRQTVMRLLELGVKDYVVKPFTPERILERVRRIIEIKPRGEPTVASNRALWTEALVRAPGEPQGQWTAGPKRSDQPLRILVVEDKPAIVRLIQNGLAGTPWQVQAVSQPIEALEACKQTLPDLILISLSLPGGAGFTLFRMLRASAETKLLPILALSVKTATEEKTQAQQLGFTSIVTKPIEVDALRHEIVRVLGLDTSHQYFQERNNALLLSLPAALNQDVAAEVATHLRQRVRDAVNAGLGRLVIDLSQLKEAGPTLFKMGLEAIQIASESGLSYAFIGSEATSKACANYQETKDWKIAKSFEAALEGA